MAWYDKTYDFIRSKRTHGLVRRDGNLLLHGSLEDESSLPLLRFGGVSLYDYIGRLKTSSAVVESSGDYSYQSTNVLSLSGICKTGSIYGFICGVGHPGLAYPPSSTRTGMVYFDKSDFKIYQADRTGVWNVAARLRDDLTNRVVLTEGEQMPAYEITSEHVYNIVVMKRVVTIYEVYRDPSRWTVVRNSGKGGIYTVERVIAIPGAFDGYSSITYPYPVDGYTQVGSADNPNYWMMDFGSQQFNSYGFGDSIIPFTKSFMRQHLSSDEEYTMSVYARAVVYDFGNGIDFYYRDGTKLDRAFVSMGCFGGGDAYESGRLHFNGNGSCRYETVNEHHSTYRHNEIYVSGVDVNFSNYGMTLGVV